MQARLAISQLMEGGKTKMVKVMIERHCRADKEVEFKGLLAQIRSKALPQLGYYSGETLRGVDDSSRWLVISSWSTVEMWKTWQNSPERQELISKMEPLLAAPEKITLFESPF